MWIKVAAVGLALAVTCAVADLAAAQRSQPKGNADSGRAVYIKDGCAQCHGREAQGGGSGPRLGPDPWAWEQFARYVRQPRGEMPPYGPKILSDQELADMYAYVQSRPKPSRPVIPKS